MEVDLSVEEEAVHLSAEVDAAVGEDAKMMCSPRRGREPLTYPCVLVALGSAPTNFSTFLSQSKKEQVQSLNSMTLLWQGMVIKSSAHFGPASLDSYY